MNEINLFAETTFRNIRKKFGIKPDDRRRHVYVVGKTGMGKTAMLQNMAIQDIQQGRGVGFVDPHGGQLKSYWILFLQIGLTMLYMLILLI